MLRAQLTFASLPLQSLQISAETTYTQEEDFCVHVEGAALQPDGAPCIEFRNEINLIDFVTDVFDIYRAFTSNIASQTPYASVVEASASLSRG
mmetsp:Transcript_42221/g.92551  ORF Transcript_42221/g.92551 Transcript_42221/m.92551 type:complete len:93 (+) Transcript_42221:965-1243(+)